MRKKIFLLFKVILLVGIFYWVFKLVNIDEIITILSKTNLALFLIAFILYNCSNVFLTIKWHRLATPLKLKTGFLELLKLNYISVFYSIFIPGQASGELIKGLKLTQRESSSQKVWIPIFIDKITNLLIIFLIGFIAILLDKKLSQNNLLIISVSLSTILLLFITIVLFSEHTNNFISHIKNILISAARLVKLNTQILDNFSLDYFEDYKRHNLIMIETLFWSFSIKIPHVFAFYFLALSLGIKIELMQAAWLFSIVSITSLLPITFSGLGIREGTVLVLMSKIGIGAPSALSFSMLIFTLGIIIGLIGGILELFSVIQEKGHPKQAI